MNIQIGVFLFLFWLHAWHKSVHNWSWFRTCRYLIGLHPKFWNTDLDYKWCVFQHSTINLLNTWLHKLIYNHLFIYQLPGENPRVQLQAGDHHTHSHLSTVNNGDRTRAQRWLTSALSTSLYLDTPNIDTVQSILAERTYFLCY